MRRSGGHARSSAARLEGEGGVPSVRLEFVSWPVAAFTGLLAGVLLSSGALWGAGFLVLPVLAVLLRGSGARWLLLVAAVATLLGGARERAWAGEGDPLRDWRGGVVTLDGFWDGRFLLLKDPPARVAVSPDPRVPAGALRVRGRLSVPPGRRNPGGFDYGAWLRVQGVHSVLVGARVLEYREERGVRAWFRRGVRSGLPEREGALMEAIQLGDPRSLQEEEVREHLSVRDAFARAGLAHLMALSGQNVALLVGVASFVLARVGVGLARYGVMVGLLVGYLWLVGASPSITRAVLMGAAVLLGLWVGRGRLNVVGTLSLAGCACVVVFPAWVFDVGFQLSFLAVLALTFTPRLAARFPRAWPRALAYGVAGTVLVEVATAPLVAHHFGQVPLVGVPANVLAAPLMAVLVPLGFLAGVLGPAGALVNVVVLPLAKLLLGLAALFGQVPALPWGVVSAAGWVAYGVFVVAFVAWLLRWLRAWQGLLLAFLCAFLTVLPGKLRPAWEVVFLDVGQGDSTLVRLGAFTMLIDGGGTPRSEFDVGERTVVPALRALGVRRLDVVVATHADADHVEGLASVLRLVPVGEVWVGDRKTGDGVLRDVLGAAEARGVPVREVRRGDGVRVAGSSLVVLWPPPGRVAAEDNENSVVVRLEHGAFRAVFLGDVSSVVEGRLRVGKVDLLKVAHHGSRFSTGDALLQEAAPADAVISVGRNTYGHPSPVVLERLRARGVRVWRTDEVGAVRWPLP